MAGYVSGAPGQSSRTANGGGTPLNDCFRPSAFDLADISAFTLFHRRWRVELVWSWKTLVPFRVDAQGQVTRVEDARMRSTVFWWIGSGITLRIGYDRVPNGLLPEAHLESLCQHF